MEQLAVFNRILEAWNSGQTAKALDLLQQHARTQELDAEVLLGYPSTRLAVYGSLAPGKSNHHMVAHLRGTWRPAAVHGVLQDRVWEAGLGFPTFSWDPSAGQIAVLIFESPDLPDYWKTLDQFEGAGYRRILVPAIGPDNITIANLYAAAS